MGKVMGSEKTEVPSILGTRELILIEERGSYTQGWPCSVAERVTGCEGKFVFSNSGKQFSRVVIKHPLLSGSKESGAVGIDTDVKKGPSIRRHALLCLQPVDNQQAMVRRESVVNLENFKKQYVRRRWKLSFSIVSLCNHLTRSLMKKVHLRPEEDLRNCESDTEEDIAKRKALHPRRRSST
ncbi:Death-associated protein kinase 2 [Tupaia chinensis]|uniref:Death-associated protein kinase 2 n=1 Tax=Tupaia chinensis TaxID=246437 RepID=L9L8K5_TUPCH|nr:Death-associated protein kinase 2 [Tupaia chinensis]